MKILGIGTDITECDRIARMLERHPESFTSRVFTGPEIDYCAGFRDPVERFTGRWAAKEAVLKTLGTGWVESITWHDVEVINEPGGKPTVRLGGGARRVAERLGISEILLSISHCKTHAVAVAIAQGPASETPVSKEP